MVIIGGLLYYSWQRGKIITNYQSEILPTPIATTLINQETEDIKTTPTTQNYPVPSTWKRVIVLGINLCLPPKWEADQSGNVYFNRDVAYRPSVTYMDDIPYTGGSRREAYYAFWERDYPNVRNTISVNEVNINSNTALLFNGPEGDSVVWHANNKLWYAGLSNWSYVNNSKTAFYSDLYTMISCSF